MCDVCVAENALAYGQCGTDSCVAFREGYTVNWEGIDQAIRVRARGGRAECEPAEFQIKLSYEPWPKKWDKVTGGMEEDETDLAGAMARYGLDVKWQYVPGPVQEWVLGGTGKPTLKEISKWHKEAKNKLRANKSPKAVIVGKKKTPVRKWIGKKKPAVRKPARKKNKA